VKWLSLISSFFQHYLTRITQTKLTPALIGAYAMPSNSATISNYQYE